MGLCRLGCCLLGWDCEGDGGNEFADFLVGGWHLVEFVRMWESTYICGYANADSDLVWSHDCAGSLRGARGGEGITCCIPSASEGGVEPEVEAGMVAGWDGDGLQA
ncbi:hypothetical protein [Rubritalea tangerina]|uniref:hypothetical protein n=1 Tax=Rubritalea tangerina TaxID=430798 RepID=UPI00360B22F2